MGAATVTCAQRHMSSYRPTFNPNPEPRQSWPRLPPPPPAPPTPRVSHTRSISELMALPNLLNPAHLPRDPIVLCHGLYGYDVRAVLGVELHYWAGIMDVLRERLGVEVIMKGVPATGSIQSRAEALHAYLCSPAAGIRGRKVHFVGHSMGGLDARYLISRIKPTPDQYTPLTLTTISTPHRGSPFMDWCNANIGIGRELVESQIACARRKGLIPPVHTHSRHRHPQVDPDATTMPANIPEDPAPALPYSLKTPLFVRRPSEPENTKKDPPPSHPPSVSKDPPLPKETSSKSTWDVSLFTRALASVGGGFSNMMLGLLDQPAYAALSTRYMTLLFNPTVPDAPGVKYFSVASRTKKLPVWHPLWLPKLVLDASAASGTAAGVRDGSAQATGAWRGNDGIVAVPSAVWGELLGVVDNADHWDLRGGGAPRFRTPRRDPITGRSVPVPAKKDTKDIKEGKEDQEKMKEAKATREQEAEEDQGWMGINRLIRALRLSAPNSSKTKAISKPNPIPAPATQSAFFAPSPVPSPTFDSPPSEPSPSPSDPSTAAAQVADWISARLPDGPRARSLNLADETEARSSFVRPPDSSDIKQAQAQLDSPAQVKHDRDESSAAVQTVMSSPRLPVPHVHRPSDEQPTTGIDSHQPDNQAQEPVPGAATKGLNVQDEPKLLSLDSMGEEERLERFWAAIMRHLYDRGY